MSVAASVREYLVREDVPFDVITHAHTRDSAHSAQAAHVPGDQLAKCVLLEDDDGYVMAVIPATHKVDLGAVHRELNRQLGLATEGVFAYLFDDCEPGALPPLGSAYGFDVVLDHNLADMSDVYFEAGDHTSLIHVSGEDFLKLMAQSSHRHISHHI